MSLNKVVIYPLFPIKIKQWFFVQNHKNKLNADGSLDGWVKLVENGEIIKPSGLPVGTTTTEDIDYAALGHDMTAAASAPSIRYIRWVNTKNWGGTTFMNIMEIEVYGKRD